MLSGLGLNSNRFARTFVMLRAKRTIYNSVTMLGPARIEHIIVNQTPLADLLPPDKLKEYQQLAAQNSWVADVISDEEFLEMLPPWVIELVVKHGQPGKQWLGQQLAWIRSLFKPAQGIAK